MSDPAGPQNGSDRLKAILLLTAAVFFAAAPFVTDGFGGFDPNRYPIPQIDPPVQPAGWAFAIWGPIYLALLAMAAGSLFVHAEDRDWDRPRWGLIVSLAIGSTWISVAQRSPVLATIMIWIMLAGALYAMLRLPKDGPWLLNLPVALYAGWLTAASFVSIGLLGAGYGIVMGEIGWAWAMVLAATAAATVLQLRRPDLPFFGAAAAWALTAIAVRNFGVETPLAIAAALAALAIAALALRGLFTARG